MDQIIVTTKKPKNEQIEVEEKVITGNQECNIEDGAETFLGIINSISLVVGIISAIILFFISADSYGGESTTFAIAGIVVLFISFVSWAIVRVLLNISINLHKINAKLK